MAEYRVRAGLSATVRRGPYLNRPIVKRLQPGDAWQGSEVRGGYASRRGVLRSDVWIADENGACVWSGLLEKIEED